MKWTKVYNIHILCIIHQNKHDNFATGWLGSSIMKKTEAIISVTKDDANPSISLVSCDLIRGVMDFKSFQIYIDNEGLPQIGDIIEPKIYENKTQIPDLPF